MNREQIIKGFLTCAIFTNEDGTLYDRIDDTHCSETSREIAGSAVDKMLNFIEQHDLKLPEYLDNSFTFGTDIWYTASGSGTSFTDRGDSEELEQLKEFCQTRLAQIEHAETWYDEEFGKFRISIYERNF